MSKIKKTLAAERRATLTKAAAAAFGPALVELLELDTLSLGELAQISLRDIVELHRKAAKPKRGRPAIHSTPSLAAVLKAISDVAEMGDDGVAWARTSQISAALDVPSSRLRKPLQALLETGRITSTGKAAGTRYTTQTTP